MSITLRDLEWTAGFYEGEGSVFLSTNGSLTTSISQVQRWPLERMVSLFGGTIRTSHKAQGNHQHCYQWRLVGPAATGFIMTLFTLLSPRRKEQIEDVLAKWKAIPPAKKYRTHCPSGHPYVEKNLYRIKGRRICKTCVYARKGYTYAY